MDILLTFHTFLLLGTSIFDIPFNVFDGFAILAKITSETLSKCRRTSKSTPTWLQNDSRSLPRRSQEDPESCQDQPKSCQDPPRDSKIGPRGHSGPSRTPKSSPRGLQKVIQQSQEPSKTSKREVWTSIFQLPNSFPGTCWFRSRCVHSESFSDTDVSTDNYMVAIKRAGKTSLEVPQRNHEGIATFRMLLFLVRTSPMAWWRLRAQPTGLLY